MFEEGGVVFFGEAGGAGLGEDGAGLCAQGRRHAYALRRLHSQARVFFQQGDMRLAVAAGDAVGFTPELGR